MKKLLLISMITMGVLILGCVKSTNLPAYKPPFAKNFSVTSFAHIADTVSAGSPIFLIATGIMSDTISNQSNIYAYFTVTSSVSGSPVYTFGSASSLLKLSRIITGPDSSGFYPWRASTIEVTTTNISPNTTLTITGNFVYQLSLSSEGGGTVTRADAGIKTKTVFVQ